MSFPDSFHAELAKAGIAWNGQPILDGKINRFKAEGDSQDNSWYCLYDNGGGFVAGKFGCWKRLGSESIKYSNRDRSKFSKEEAQTFHAQCREAEAARAAEELKLQEKARTTVKELLTTKLTDHDYLLSKGFPDGMPTEVTSPAFLCTQGLYPGWIAVPLQDSKGTIHSAQFIAEDGTKKFQYGGRVKGCFYNLSERPHGPIVICEGFATGLSIFLATGWTVKCAMSAGNLLSVAKDIAALPESDGRQIIIAGDNDQFTKDNPGLTKAREAIKALSKSILSYPSFSKDSLPQKPTDFNDLHRLEGQPELFRQLTAAMSLSTSWVLCDAADTMEKVLPEPIQIIEGLLCEKSKLIVGGSSKTYKSWFLGDLGLSLSVGGVVIGRQCKPLRVLYVNLELKESTFERRIQTIIHAKGIKLDRNRFHFLSLRGKLAGLKIQHIIDRILSFMARIACEAVLLDPLYKLNTEGEENSAKDQTLFFNQLDRLTTEGGSSVIAADHFGKGNQSEKDPLDAIRGSSAKGGDLDAAIILRKHKDEGSFSVDVIHRELPPIEPFVLTWQFPLFEINPDLNAADMKKPGGRLQQHDPLELLSLIKNTTKDNPISTAEWAELADIERTTLGTYMTKLRQQGFITTIGSGPKLRKYITLSGLQALNGY